MKCVFVCISVYGAASFKERNKMYEFYLFISIISAKPPGDFIDTMSH